MKTASRILGTAFFLQGYEVQDAPRYGAERRGAPIFAYVRADHRPIHERGIIRRPDLVVVADDSLVPIPAAAVLSGMDAHTVLLLNSHEAAEHWRERLNLSGPILILPAPEEVGDRAELRYVGAACAAAAACLTGAVTRDAIVRAIREELAPLGAAVVSKNLEVATAAYDRMAADAGLVTEGEEDPVVPGKDPGWVELPPEAAVVSAPTIHAAATSERQETGLWRTMRPEIDHRRCNRCWWVCSTFCPDGAIAVDEQGYPQIDYAHCKGCLICVAQCPPHAIEATPEHLVHTQKPGGK